MTSKTRLLQWTVMMTVLGSVVSAQDPKSAFDVTDVKSERLAKTTISPLAGWKCTKSVSEVSVMAGGFMTWGTTAGTSPLSLDDKNTLLFGHPYARTSYPLICLDGTWKRADELFSRDSSRRQMIGDSVLILEMSGHPLLSMTIRYSLLENGARLLCELEATLAPGASHQLGIGHALDPEVGPRGDACVRSGLLSLLRDTAVAGRDLRFTERRWSPEGVRFTLTFPDVLPASLLLMNWNDGTTSEAPELPPTHTRIIYDGVVKFYWDPQTTAGGTVVKRRFSLMLEQPDFGTSLYTRWNVPRFLAIENGTITPASLPTLVSLFNKGNQTASSVVTMASSPYISSPIQSASASVLSQQWTNVQYPLLPTEVYENVVAELTASVTVSGVPVDSIVIPVFVPATPVSDTGLIVTIDSLMRPSASEVALRFEVANRSTGRRFFNLEPRNIQVAENGVRIPAFSLRKDTSQGSSALDIVFVLDVTGSMSGIIQAVKDNIIEFADSLSKSGVDYRLGMVTFLDIVETIYPFTSNALEFKGYVSAQYAHGGGDAPENSLEALYRASQFPFRPNAKRTAIWITDITYHENNSVTPRTKAEVIAKLLENDMVVHAVGPPGYQTSWYNPIIEPTGGMYFSIFGNFRDILINISNIHSTSKHLLRYVSPLSSVGLRIVLLTIHVAGLGGEDSTEYSVPGVPGSGAPVVCYPNPFNPRTTIQLIIPALGRGRITVFNMLGQEVRKLAVSGNAMDGAVRTEWDGTDREGRAIASGIYFVRAEVMDRAGGMLSASLTKVVFLK